MKAAPWSATRRPAIGQEVSYVYQDGVGGQPAGTDAADAEPKTEAADAGRYDAGDHGSLRKGRQSRRRGDVESR